VEIGSTTRANSPRDSAIAARSSSPTGTMKVNNCRVNATACASTRTPSRRIGHDRLVDTQPAEGGYTAFSTVLSRDVTRSIEVGMQRVATRTTHKQSPGTAVVAGSMPTLAARLGGMSWVNHDHPTAPFLSFVPDKPAQLRERPRVDTPLRFGLASHPGALANVFEVFQHERSAHLCRLNDLFGECVIAITAEARLLVAHLAQMPFGRFGALLLQRPLELE
jgi:hypothetical protein